MQAETVPEITPAVATWLGWQAARLDRIDEGRAVVSPDLADAYERGVALPEEMSVICPGGENLRRRLLRRLGGDTDPKRRVPPLEVVIAGMVQRRDVGTATRYDVTLRRGDRSVTLRDLVASDVLTWSRLRPIAMDAGMVLSDLEKGQARMWLAEVERAMGSARIVQLSPDESEAGEIMDVLRDIMEIAQTWEWSEDDTYPRGIARVVLDGKEGWTRGPIEDAMRAKLGRVGRVQKSRALAAMGLSRAEWRYGAAYVRVWCRPLRAGDEA
jgi:hypothetical protein